MANIETTIIKPGNAWFRLDLRELFRHRDLLYFLALRDIKIKYKQAAVGVAWVLLQPLVTVAIFTVLFSRLAQFDSGSIPYPLLALSGLVIWLFIHKAVSMASTSFIINTNLVTKIYFPRLLMPLAAAVASLVDFAISLLILVVFLVYYRTSVSWHLLLTPVFLVLAILLAASLGILFSALSVRFRDVQLALPFFLQVWMLASPIFYPASILSEKWRLVFALNPLVGILDGFRGSLLGLDFDWTLIGFSVLSIAVIAFCSVLVFKWMEDSFADIV